MLSYHSDPAIKAKYLARVRAHREADEIVQGIGWDGTRGCAVGCALESYDHSRYPIELGIQELLARLEDRIFEGLPNERAMLWPERFLAAISVGVDLSPVWPRFAVWLLTDATHGVLRHAGDRQDVANAINRVAELYRTGGTEEQFKAAGAEAWAAAGAEAWAAAQTNWYIAASDKLVEFLSSAGGGK